MNRPKTSSISLRLAVLLLVIPLCWLAQRAGNAGIAGIYGATAASYREQLDKSRDPVLREQLLIRGVEKIGKARAIMPGHPGFAMQAADLATLGRDVDFTGENTAVREISGEFLRAVLITDPANSDLWWRLARYEYEETGVSPPVGIALQRSLFYGPREAGPLLLNAMVIFNSGARLDADQRLRGWNAAVEAASMPALASQVNAMARSAGVERQLHRLLQEKSRQRMQSEARKGAG